MNWDYKEEIPDDSFGNEYISSVAIGFNDLKEQEKKGNLESNYIEGHAIIINSSEIKNAISKAKGGLVPEVFLVIADIKDRKLREEVKTLIREWDNSSIIFVQTKSSVQELYYQLTKEINNEMMYMKELMDTHYIKLVHLLTQDADIKEIEEMAYTILGNPMVITDESYKVLAYSQGIKTDDPIWLTIVGNDYCPFSIVEMTDHNQFWKRLNKASRPLFVDSEDFSPYIQRAVAQVSSDGKTRGYIALLEINKKIAARDLQILQMVAEVVGSILSKKDAVSKAKGHLERVLINDLFYGKMAKETMIQNRAQSLGWNLKKYYGVLCIEGFTIKHVELENKLEDIKKQLKTYFPFSVYSFDDNKAFFIVGIDDQEKWMPILQRNLVEFMFQEGLTCSAGLLVNNLIDIIKSYNQAIDTSSAIAVIQGKIGKKSVYIYSEVAIYTLLMKWIQDEERENLSCTSLQTLQEIDEKEGSEYVFTLKNFFENNQNVTATAQAMFLHRNTINYRLNKMKDLLEDDFDHPLIRLHLYISILIQDIIE